VHQSDCGTHSGSREEGGQVTYFSQREFQAFVAAAVGHINCGWLALSGRVLSKNEARELEQLLDQFFRSTGHRSFKQHA
jgi:RNA-splicing ligase RtcB